MAVSMESASINETYLKISELALQETIYFETE